MLLRQQHQMFVQKLPVACVETQCNYLNEDPSVGDHVRRLVRWECPDATSAPRRVRSRRWQNSYSPRLFLQRKQRFKSILKAARLGGSYCFRDLLVDLAWAGTKRVGSRSSDAIGRGRKPTSFVKSFSCFGSPDIVSRFRGCWENALNVGEKAKRHT
jgi:hypothetical protein